MRRRELYFPIISFIVKCEFPSLVQIFLEYTQLHLISLMRFSLFIWILRWTRIWYYPYVFIRLRGVRGHIFGTLPLVNFSFYIVGFVPLILNVKAYSFLIMELQTRSSSSFFDCHWFHYEIIRNMLIFIFIFIFY